MTSPAEIPTILSPVQATTVSASNTTAFALAAQTYGDAMQWTRIVKFNPGMINADGFWEYQISALTTLDLPPPDTSGAVYTGVMDAFPAPAVSLGRDFNSDFGGMF